ncbi:MAG: sulfatase-like hydrolase/transferase [Verrucomicrobia bacterium]|nr:sulfatase-like hydrolase/transferase [Verrucomicrobiota bacterium]
MRALYFFILNLSVPVCLRVFFSRASTGVYARWVGFLEDLFVVFELSLLVSISAALTALLGCFIHLFLIVDYFLFHRMQLRINLSYLSHLHHVKSLYPSAKALGAQRLLPMGVLVCVGHLIGYFFVYQQMEISLGYAAGALGIGGLAALGGKFLPKSAAYSVGNILFEEQRKCIERLSSKRKKSFRAGPEFLWNKTAAFSGEPQFEVKIGLEEKPHVILVFLESFAAFAVGENTTPRFHELAQEGILFSNFYSNGTLTYRALLAGLFGIPPGNTTQGLLPYMQVPLAGLPQLFKKAGYTSAFYHNGPLGYDRQAEFLKNHFDVIVDRKEMEEPGNDFKGWGTPDEDLMRYTVDGLQKQQQPTFTILFTISNHHPWIVPKHHLSPVFDLPENSSKNRFLQTVHYTDYSLGLLVNLLKEKGLSKKTILVLVGDHGQPMGQHEGNFYNSRFLYEENVRVPLLILAEGRIKEPKVISEIGSHVDLLPTFMDLFQWEGCHPSCGASLLRPHPDKAVMLQNPYSEGFLGCRKGKWKWIENQLTAEGELYDLEEDPGEKSNASESHPEIAEALRLETCNYFIQLDQFYAQDETSQKMGASVYELDLSSTMVTDKELMNLDSRLMKLSLHNCLLITDEGIASVFSRCPHLEELSLQGITDLTGRALAVAHGRLRLLDISDAEEITDAGMDSFAHCPLLSVLSLNGRRLTDQGIEALARHCKHLTRFKLLKAHQMTDAALLALLQNNRHLGRLVIEGCMNLTDRFLKALQEHPLELLWLVDAPQITDEGVACLTRLPLRFLRLEGCPLLTEKYLPDLRKMKLESLYLNNTFSTRS